MKPKFTIVAMVVLAAILIASPVLAAGSSRAMEVAKQVPIKKKWKKATVISMTAAINRDEGVAVTGTGRINVAIKMTNKAFIQYRGEDEWVKITSSTVCIEWLKAKKSQRIKCKDLVAESMAEDRMISINARLIDGEFRARRVQMLQPRLP